MNSQNQQDFLYAIWCLRGKAEPKILRFLRERVAGARWTEIENKINDVKSSTIHDALERLVREGLARERNRKYSITAHGLWALNNYERISSGPSFKGLPKFILDLVAANDFHDLLAVQADFLRKHLDSKTNVIVFASPSAGKTFMAECLILKALRSHGTVAYLTPYRALNRQKFDLLRMVFGERFHYDVQRVDGDTPTRLEFLDKADVVASTYERALGAVLRNEKWIVKATLVVADELTILADERGENLDLLLTFLRQRSKRLLTLSSHVGNSEVVAEWLDAKVFSPEPADLSREFIVESRENYSRIEDRGGTESHTDESPALVSILKHLRPSHEETILILTGTRSKAELFAEEASRLLERSSQLLSDGLMAVCDERTPLVNRLSSCVAQGAAFHHAGLTQEVRRKVEDFLNERRLTVVSSTPTLSHGVDFPIDSVIIYLDSFDFRKEFPDQEAAGLKMIEYVQYKGRAARLYKSRRGWVYLVSNTLSVEAIRKGFLSTGPEPLNPPTLSNPDTLEWIILLQVAGQRRQSILLPKLTRVCFDFISSLLAYRTLPSEQEGAVVWLPRIEDSVHRLANTGLIEFRGNYVKLSKLGRKVSNTAWVPRDSSYVISSLWQLNKIPDTKDLANKLLFLACNIGLVRGSRDRRVESFVEAFRAYAHDKGLELAASPNVIETQAKVWVLQDWIEEKTLREITRRLRYVDDADIPQLGHYAAIEMQKIASLAADLKLKQVADVANTLAERLRHGAREDLVTDPDVRILRLDCVGRRKARILVEHQYRNLLDILSQLFREDEQVFIDKCGLKPSEAREIIKEIRAVLELDSRLRKRATKL